MASNSSLRRYRNAYARLLRLYSKAYYERFGEGMAQTFNDILRERADEGRGVSRCVLWLFAETLVGIFRENLNFIRMQYKNIIRIVLVVATILMVPLVAMLFTDEVAWTLFDFVVAGALLLGTGLAYEFLTRKGGSIAYRAAAGLALAGALFLVWVNLAVGIIGTENNPANLMYVGVLAVGAIGAAVARFRPGGMAHALFATAIAQAVVAAVALCIGQDLTVVLDGFFIALWSGSAVLFLRARDTDPTWKRPTAP
jgi:hypothetical protein